MHSVVYVACLLAAYAAASPAQVERRFAVPMGPIGGGGYQMSQSQSQQAASQSQSSYNSGYGGGYGGGIGGFGLGGGVGGIGGGGFSQSSSSYSASSSSSSSVYNSFAGLGSQIAQMQGALAAGSMTQSFAMQQMSSLASSFQSALALAPQCGSCFGQGPFATNVNSVFSQFTSLMMSMQSQFGGSFSQICAPFAGLQSSFQTFFQSASASGVSMNTLVPGGFINALSPIIPGIGNGLSTLGFK